MIGGFQDKKLELFWLEDKRRNIPINIVNVLRNKLNMIAFAEVIEDLRVPPSNHLEALKGKLEGFYSIRVNKQWRLVFKWHGNYAFNLRLTDYH
ncbi:type II toxin-antitoxin system RelE/ParE family toxin [Sedimentisphaera salicampi]|uniref:Toxin HigB-1 n=1 Tax=Sedimentisphaera salicampi TaxID=1941349 RepID=A0A1W6LPR5_9BACT|nr:type II toxin-antitoxin system RelE/ParE family toxin [Sedimentisphaera salicampi]ARN57722.1 Toxin HigB-1 [Sedimentisphaera salicampi]OXU14280.1 Toxin HigB-1 [Sedimentisphaera salicampi]